MKKFISTLAASVLAVSSLPVASASALEITPKDVLSVSTEILDEAITVDDTVIPAGATAVTISISNNTGFFSSSVKFEITDGYEAITSNNIIATNKGTVIDDSIICGVENENIIFISTASAFNSKINGEMFTFYVENVSSNEDFNISIIDSKLTNTLFSASENDSVSPNTLNSGYYKVGDVDNDGHIDSTDASAVLGAIAINDNKKLSGLLSTLKSQ